MSSVAAVVEWHTIWSGPQEGVAGHPVGSCVLTHFDSSVSPHVSSTYMLGMGHPSGL